MIFSLQPVWKHGAGGRVSVSACTSPLLLHLMARSALLQFLPCALPHHTHTHLHSSQGLSLSLLLTEAFLINYSPLAASTTALDLPIACNIFPFLHSFRPDFRKINDYGNRVTESRKAADWVWHVSAVFITSSHIYIVAPCCDDVVAGAALTPCLHLLSRPGLGGSSRYWLALLPHQVELIWISDKVSISSIQHGADTR